MASSSSTAPTAAMPVTSSVTVRLNHTNYMLWRAQMITHLRSHPHLLGHITGSTQAPPSFIEEVTGTGDDRITSQVTNPEYATWYVRDQTVLSGFFATVTEEVLASIMGAPTAHDVWMILEGMFSSRSRVRVIQIRTQLTAAKKKGTPAVDYFRQMKHLADTLAAIGQPLHEEETISYILAGLGPDYDALVTSLTTRNDDITLDEIYSHLLAFEQHHEQHDADLVIGTGGTSANFSGRQQGGRPNYGGGDGNQQGGGDRGNQGRGRGQGHGGGRGGPPQGRGNGGQGQQGGNGGQGHNGGGGAPRPVCQICNKVGHNTIRCYQRYNHAYNDDEPSANHATTGYNVDPTWYMDTGETDHITSDLDRLAVRDAYNGNERVHVGNGADPQNPPPKQLYELQISTAPPQLRMAKSSNANAMVSDLKEQDGPEPTQIDGSPFTFLPPAPVVLFCQSSPALKKVIMQGQPISPKSAPKSKASSGPAAPRVSTQARKAVRKVAARKTLKRKAPIQTNETSSGDVEEVLPPSATLDLAPSTSVAGQVDNLAKSIEKPIITTSAAPPIITTSAAPSTLREGCDLSTLLTFDPESIEPATHKTSEQPIPGTVHGPLQRLKALLSSSIETLVLNPEAVKGILEEIQPHLPVTLQVKLWPAVTLSAFRSRVQSARQRITLRHAQLPLRADIAGKCQRLSEKKTALDAKTDTSASSAELETLRKELENLEERVRMTKQLIHEKETLIARSREEAQGLRPLEIGGNSCPDGQVVTGEREDDEAEIAEVDHIRADALRALDEFLQKNLSV
ncbi:hypothetical protein QYE76_007893 [Lolium multiflorum]|uniref:Retrotransposon Copia-like N-terminal domain-containing protein n=1 Tax=Lolium multiflorum TaxID=4521 RepID=A0AAD8QEN5_LOLMU|nr:hypothetical protein QYE76_007893 [Lolium multiflorum]